MARKKRVREPEEEEFPEEGAFTEEEPLEDGPEGGDEWEEDEDEW